MAKNKIHLAGSDPWALSGRGPSNHRFLGCSNPSSENAIATHKDSDNITTDPARVTCWRCRAKLAEAVRP